MVIILKDPPSILKKTKLGFILSKENISCFSSSFANFIIPSSTACSSLYFPKISIDLFWLKRTPSKGDLVKTFVNEIKFEITEILAFSITGPFPS